MGSGHRDDRKRPPRGSRRLPRREDGRLRGRARSAPRSWRLHSDASSRRGTSRSSHDLRADAASMTIRLRWPGATHVAGRGQGMVRRMTQFPAPLLRTNVKPARSKRVRVPL